MNLFGLPSGATEQALWMHSVWTIFAIAGAVVAAIVYALIFWCTVRYRRRQDSAEPPQFRNNVPLEVAYTIVPVLIVAALFYVSFRTEAAVERVAPDPPLTVDVTAFRWSWRFDYAGSGASVTGTPAQPPQLVLPVGEPVRIVLTSADVVHAFWVPAFLFKRDAVPGMRTVFEWDLTTAGVYDGRCAEFCGLDHAEHAFTVRAVAPDAFAAWLEVASRR